MMARPAPAVRAHRAARRHRTFANGKIPAARSADRIAGPGSILRPRAAKIIGPLGPALIAGSSLDQLHRRHDGTGALQRRLFLLQSNQAHLVEIGQFAAICVSVVAGLGRLVITPCCNRASVVGRRPSGHRHFRKTKCRAFVTIDAGASIRCRWFRRRSSVPALYGSGLILPAAERTGRGYRGAGGSSLGFKSAGYDLVGAVEMDAVAASTYALNLHKEAPEGKQVRFARPRGSGS
jgi:C-5 cytosine-specific DNA methylase